VALSPQQPEFFIDRSLGRNAVAAALRADGWDVRTLAEVYGAHEETVPDEKRLGRCADEGWIVLTKDKRIRYRPAEIEALRTHRVKAFVLASGNLSADAQSQRFIANRLRIEAACVDPGPFVYSVQSTRILRLSSS
jgi:PIN like domain